MGKSVHETAINKLEEGWAVIIILGPVKVAQEKLCKWYTFDYFETD